MIQLQICILHRLLDLGLTTDAVALLVAVSSLCGKVAVLASDQMEQPIDLGIAVAVTCCGNGLLCDQNSLAEGAMFAGRLTCGGTGGGNGIGGDGLAGVLP